MYIAASTTANVGKTVALQAGDRVIGVVLEREIQNNVKVRPTNVTANIAHTNSTVGTIHEPDYILLHNGPKGGFRQELIASGAGNYIVNDVIQGVIVQR